VVTQVKAQVMTRDDSTGGWVPVSGGGLSIVALVCRKVPLISGDEVITDNTPIGVEFVIQGRRISDHEVIAFLDSLLL
jgi:sprouty-related, EVH1 domain-containing protein